MVDERRWLVGGIRYGKTTLKRISDLELRLADAQAGAAALREWILVHHPGAQILELEDAGREVLDRLALAEDESNEALVDALFEMRDGLMTALTMVDQVYVKGQGFTALRELLNRWGEPHLRLVKGRRDGRKDTAGGRRGGEGGEDGCEDVSGS